MDSLSAQLFIVCSVLFENPHALALIYLLAYISLAGFNKAMKLHLLTFFINPEQ